MKNFLIQKVYLVMFLEETKVVLEILCVFTLPQIKICDIKL